MRTNLPLIVALTLLSAACTALPTAPSTASAGPDGGAASGSGSNAVVANLSCVEILQCVSECADSDTACPDACGNKGTPDGQAKALALASCIQKEGCMESTCVETKCKTPVDECVASSAPKAGGTPLQGDAPAGSVPTDLVGAWSYTAYGSTHTLTMNADGTGSWFIAIASDSSGCIQLNSTTATGSVVVSADKITVYGADVVNLEKICSAHSTRTAGPPITEEFAFTHPDTATLVVIDAVCAKDYADSPASVNLYCQDKLTRM